ncbi:lyase, partial [Sphingomonas sp. MAH-20]
MTIFNVATAAELSSAIAGAAGGDRIVVADGNYGKLSIFNRSFDSTVTIVAANPGAGAHFDGLTITGSKNVSLVGLDLGR